MAGCDARACRSAPPEPQLRHQREILPPAAVMLASARIRRAYAPSPAGRGDERVLDAGRPPEGVRPVQPAELASGRAGIERECVPRQGAATSRPCPDSPGSFQFSGRNCAHGRVAAAGMSCMNPAPCPQARAHQRPDRQIVRLTGFEGRIAKGAAKDPACHPCLLILLRPNFNVCPAARPTATRRRAVFLQSRAHLWIGPSS